MLKVKEWLKSKGEQFKPMHADKFGNVNIARRLSDSRIFFRNMNYKFIDEDGSLVIKEFLPDKIHVKVDIMKFNANFKTTEIEINELGSVIKIRLGPE